MNIKQFDNTLRQIAKYQKQFDHIRLKLIKAQKDLIAQCENIDTSVSTTLSNETISLKEAIKKCNGDRNKAAKLLKMSRSTFFRRLKANGLTKKR